MGFGKDMREWQHSGLTLIHRTYQPSQFKPIHIHSGATFFLVLEGGMSESCAGRDSEAGPLALIAQSAGIEHSTKVSRAGMRAVFIEVSDDWLREHSLSPAASQYQRCDDGRVLHAVGAALELLHGECDRLPFEERVLALCAGLAEDSSTVSDRRLHAVEQIIQEQFYRPLSLSTLAETAHVHPVHLARLFRARYQRSISGYLRAVRVKEALRMAANMPLGEVALECGFADQSHMCRSVRRELGHTPGQVFSALHSG